MKKTFQKTLIAAAAGVALMSAVGTASANSLLFPYWTTATGAQSVLTIAGNNAIVGNAVGRESLHYVYNYGPTCTHFDNFGSITKNDLMQHSIASPTTAGGFGKAVSTDASTPFYFSSANSYGFLVVSTKTTAAANLISGEMAIVDPASGLVASYAGISNGLDTSAAGNEGNFAAIVDQNFNLSFFGSGITATSWYGVVTGNMNAKIVAGQDWDGSATVSNQGVVYNNDESPFSGTVSKRINCGGTFTTADLMNSAQSDAIGAGGGLIHALTTQNVVAADGVTPISVSNGLVLMKLQSVKAAVGAPFAGKQFLHREAAPAF